MPQMSFAVDDVAAACHWLNVQVERLEVAGKRIQNIQYPPSLAERLGIAEEGGRARYGKHPASPLNEVPYQLVIEYEG
jgi:hypothetical protein